MNSAAIKLPVRVQFLKSASGGFAIAGTPGAVGDAGWSVVACENIEHVREVMADFPQARMPCWRRFE